jgi:hypothetical protein
MADPAVSASPDANSAQPAPAVPRVPVWIRWAMPSLRDLIFLVLLLSLTCGTLAPRLFRDGGTGWHLRAGQLILSTHSLPQTDPFSVSTAGRPWFAWEWLADLAMGAASGWARLYGVSLLAALVIASTFALLFTMLRERGTELFVAIGLVLLCFASATIHMFARPHVASWLLTLIWLRLLESARRGNPTKLWWLPPLMVVWVNVHGGFLLGLVLLGIYGVDALWEAGREPSPAAQRWARVVGYALAASVAATLLNPYGYMLHIHIYQYLTNPFLMDHIQEFQAPNFHGLAERGFALLVLLAVAGLALWRHRIPIRDLLILLLAVSSGLYASRNLPTASMLIALVIGPIWSQVFGENSPEEGNDNLWRAAFSRMRVLESRMGRTDATLRGGLWIILGVVLIVFAAAHGGALGTLQMQAEFEDTRFPVQAVSFLQMQGLHDPVFSTDQWGGYLIYRLFPAKVMVDDRHDLYGSEFFENYLRIVRVEPGWRDRLRSMHVTRILVPAGSSLAGALEGASSWQVEYKDSTAVLFRRTGFLSGS